MKICSLYFISLFLLIFIFLKINLICIVHIGAEILDNAFCEPYNDAQSNLFLDCGNWRAASAICEQTDSQQGKSSTYLATCSAENRTWSEGRCTESSEPGMWCREECPSGIMPITNYSIGNKNEEQNSTPDKLVP